MDLYFGRSGWDVVEGGLLDENTGSALYLQSSKCGRSTWGPEQVLRNVSMNAFYNIVSPELNNKKVQVLAMSGKICYLASPLTGAPSIVLPSVEDITDSFKGMIDHVYATNQTKMFGDCPSI